MRKRALQAVLAALFLVAVATGGVVHAIEPPRELNVVCVDRKDNVYQAVDPSVCARGETSYRLPQDRPFRVCAELHFGWWRKVSGPSSCTSRERAQTVPDDGSIYVCSGNIQGGTTLPRGRLRRVDDPSHCDPRSETAYVTPAAPTAIDDGFSIGEDLLLDVPAKGVLLNDKDLTGAPLTATLVSGTDPGSLSLRSDGGFAYDPRGEFEHLDEGEKAFDSFRYIANDGALDAAPATATVTIVGRNDEPIARVDDYATDEDSVLRVTAPGVLANDTDAEDHPLTAILVSDLSRGTLALSPDGSFAFDPNRAFDSLAAGESAIVSFTYLARDGTADSTIARVTITVTGRNDAPIAGQDAYVTDENTVLRIAAPGVLDNDLDAEGQTLHADLAAGPSAGELTLAADGSLVFDPRDAFDSLASGQTAPATFAYRAIDSQGAASAAVQVTINVTGVSPPGAVADTRTTDEDSPIEIDVLSNDLLRGGTITDVDPIVGGAGEPDTDGDITYEPRGAFDDLQAGETREGSFRYTLTNDEGSSTATVRITVEGRNDPPVPRADDYTASDDATLSVPGPGVLGNDTDAEDDALTAVLVSPPSKGRLTLSSNGSFDFQPAGDLSDGAEETVSFAYRASDGRSESSTATVTIHVGGVNDPPAVGDQTFSIAEGSANGTAVGTVAFTDPDAGQDHTYEVVSGNGAGVFALDSATGEITVADASGLDAEQTPFLDLVVRVIDAGGLSDTGRVRINVSDVDEPPAPTDDEYAVVGNTELAAGGAAPQGPAFKADPRTVLANDSDPESGGLTVVPASGETSPPGAAGAHGRYSIAADGSFSYHPPRGYNGPDSFDYTVDDGTTQRTATVRLTVDDMVWYVDNHGLVTGDGTSTLPFSSIAPVAAASALDDDGPGHTIFLFAGSGPYDGQIALEAGQRLLGQGRNLVVGGATLVVAQGATPLLSASGAAVTLATDNQLRGLNVEAAGGAAISGSGFGSLTADLDSVTSTGGAALALTDGTAAAAFGALSSSGSPGSGVDLTRIGGSLSTANLALSDSGAPALRSVGSSATIGAPAGSIASSAGGVLVVGGSGRLDLGASIATTGGHSVEVAGATAPTGGGCAVHVRGTVDDAGSGISLAGNSGRVCFSGRLTLRTAAADAFSATESPVTVTGATNTIETSTGIGLRLTDVAVASDGITFRRVSTNGAVNGIAIDGLSGVGTLAVSGTGGPDTGGIVRASSAAGIAIADASNVSLGGVRVTQSQGDGIVLAGTDNVAIKQGVVEDSGGYGIRGTDTRSLNVTNGTTIQRSAREGVHLINVLGASSFSTGVLRASHGESHIVVRNATATAARPAAPADVLRLESMRYEETVETFIDAESRVAGNLQLLVGTPNASTPSFMRDGATGVRARAVDGGRLDVDVTKLFREFGTGDAVSLEAGGASSGGEDALLTFDIFDNNIDRGGRFFQQTGAAVRMLARTDGLLRGTVQNNVIAQPFGGGIIAVADGGRIEPDIGSNQITQPGCLVPGTFSNRCTPIITSPLVCPSAAEPLPNGITLTSQGGGVIAGAVRSNEIPDPLGGGIVAKAVADSTVDLQLTGNRIQQSLGCTFQGNDGFPILARAQGGTLGLNGGANTAILTSSPQHAIVIDSIAGGSATVDLAGDVARGGGDGVLGRGLGGSDLDIDVSRLTRTDGAGHAVELLAAGADPGGASSLRFSVIDSDAAHGAGISDPGGHGIVIDAGLGTTATGTIERNDISAPAADGIRVRADGAEVDARIASNTIMSAGGDGISAHGASGSRYTRAEIERNSVTDPLADGIELIVSDSSTAAGSIGGNSVEQTVTGRLTGTPILARATGGSLDLAPTGGGNEVTLTDSASDAILVEALGGSDVAAEFGGGRLVNGATGLHARAVASDLRLGMTDLVRTGGTGDGIRVEGDGAVAGHVVGSTITGAGGRGIRIAGDLGTVSVAGNEISGVGGAPIEVHSTGGAVDPLDLQIASNTVDGSGSSGDALSAALGASGSATLVANTIRGALGGGGIAVASNAGSQSLLVQGNDVQPASGAGPGIEIAAAGGTPCLALPANTSSVPGHAGFSLVATSAFGLDDLQPTESVPEWVLRKGNNGTVDHTGSFSTCAA